MKGKGGDRDRNYSDRLQGRLQHRGETSSAVSAVSRPQHIPPQSPSWQMSNRVAAYYRSEADNQEEQVEYEEDWAVRQIPPSSKHYQTPAALSQNPRTRPMSKSIHNCRLMNSPIRVSTSEGLVLDATRQQRSPSASSTASTSVVSNRWSRLLPKQSRSESFSHPSSPLYNIHTRTSPPRLHAREALQNNISSSDKVVETQSQSTAITSTPPTTAARFAQDAPLAGFLLKMGHTIPEFKRRFFVLQPATHLYYFLGANDPQPRGCLDLSDSWIEDDEDENTKEFSICWRNNQNRVRLQASSTEQAAEWKKALQDQRLDVVQARLEKERRQTAGYKARVKELEVCLDHFKLMEQDRNLAVEEADMLRHQMSLLDNGLLRVATVVQRKIRNHEGSASDDQSTPKVGNLVSGEDVSDGQDGDRSTSNGDENVEDEKKEPDNSDAFEVDESITHEELSKLPGNHFHTLHNAFMQLQGQWKCAMEESATAVLDLRNSQEEQLKLQKRMEKAEQSLLKMWEENCELRKQLKQRKREKKVLVQEVRNLQKQVQNEMMKQLKESANDLSASNPRSNDDVGDSQQSEGFREKDRNDNSFTELAQEDAERLLNELQEHVSTSLILHEQMLKGGFAGTTESKGEQTKDRVNKFANKLSTGNHEKNDACVEPEVSKSSETSNLQSGHDLEQEGNKEPALQPSASKSLFDDDDEEDESETGDECHLEPHTTEEEAEEENEADLSSIKAEMGDEAEYARAGILGSEELMLTPPVAAHSNPHLVPSTTDSSQASTPERPNPLLQLDEDTPVRAMGSPSLNVDPRRPLFTRQANQATTALDCPLADVTGRSQHDSQDPNKELQVYHLTFYSKKIGLQFQKAPPPPVKARGLLTEAMTADLAGVEIAEEKTAAELRRIANLSTWAKADTSPSTGQRSIVVATPVDAVLVCGFQGFDDSGPNVRPKLGARLVAFDGMSVEVGQWTFDSIRKAIQTRGRPLTLSFRDDFLTTEQRQALTRAISESAEHMNGSVPAALRSPRPRRDATHSVSSGSLGSYEADQGMIMDEESVRSIQSSRSVHWEDEDSSHQPRSASFVSRGQAHGDMLYHNGTYSHHNPAKFRSFSDAGSTTSSVLSAVGPLMANLLSKTGTSSAPFTPEYMRRPQVSVEDTPQHQDFQAGLL